MSKLKPRERDAIVQALRAGVVPKLGLRHIQVGRVREIEELVKDMDRISDGGSAIRFIIGEYGSGKTFFMNLIRLVALEKGLVVMFADLAPDRRIHARLTETLKNGICQPGLSSVNALATSKNLPGDLSSRKSSVDIGKAMRPEMTN